VLPLSLGIEAMGGIVEKILPRNTPIPTAATQVFTTYADNQTGFSLHVVQGEREQASDCRSLARFTLRGIPPMPAGAARLELRFEVDPDGILHVSARELTTGIAQQVDVKPSYGLTDEEIERMLLDAYEHAEADIAQRALLEQRVEAERILQATEAAMRADAALLLPEEQARMQQAMVELRAAVSRDDARRIASCVESLDEASRPFAGRRMDLRIREALTGQRLEDVERETAHAQGIEGHLGAVETD
jgi:molecular chaperone HscA